MWSNLHTNRINLIELCHEIHLSEKSLIKFDIHFRKYT